MSSFNPSRAPKVNVYIPTYNYGTYLEKSVESVLKQNYNDWELIIIDDGSTDETGTILAKFKGNPKIRIYNQALIVNKTYS